MKLHRASCLFALVMMTLPGYAASALEPHPLLGVVTQAIARAESVRLTRWAYTRTTVNDGLKTIEKHDPALPRGERWQLLLKEDKPPTPKELAKYAADQRRRGSRGGERPFRGAIDSSSLTILSNDAARIYCEFQPRAGDEEERQLMSKIRGLLVVRRDPAHVEQVDVANTGTIGKTGVFSIREFKLNIAFAPQAGREEPLPKTVATRLRGRALIIKSLNMDSSVSYSDFVWKPTTNAPAAQPRG